MLNYIKPPSPRSRPLSWSSLSLFAGLGGYPADKEKWYRNYVLGIKEKPNKEMVFGLYIDKKIQAEPCFIPSLARYDALQHEIKAKLIDIPLIGYLDAYRAKWPSIRDYKTGKSAWTQAKADGTGQLTMYCLLLWLRDKIRPEDITLFIDWLPTQENGDFSISLVEPIDVQTFETKRTMMDILKFAEVIKKIRGEMIEFCKNYKYEATTLKRLIR